MRIQNFIKIGEFKRNYNGLSSLTFTSLMYLRYSLLQFFRSFFAFKKVTWAFLTSLSILRDLERFFPSQDPLRAFGTHKIPFNSRTPRDLENLSGITSISNDVMCEKNFSKIIISFLCLENCNFSFIKVSQF